MGKAPDAFRTISEVADWLGVQTHVLRFWESKFSQVKPLKRAGGRRYYRPADMELLGGIRKLLHEDGLTIKGAQKFIRENGVKAVAEMSPPLDDADATPAQSPASGVEAAAAMVPETDAEVHVHPAPAEPDSIDAVVEITGEEPAPAAEVHISRDGPDEAVDMTGEAPAPAVEPEPDVFESAVSMEGEAPATAAQVHIQRDGPEQAVDITGEEPAPAVEPEAPEPTEQSDPAEDVLVLNEQAAPAPEQKANDFRDVSGEDDEDLKLPSFIRKPMEGRETTIPPITPGPLPLTDAEPEPEPEDFAETPEDTRFSGVGAETVPDGTETTTDDAAPEESPLEHSEPTPETEPVDFSTAVAPDADMPMPQRLTATPEAGFDASQLRPLYDRLLALRERMG